MVGEREEFWSHQHVRIAGGVAVGLLMFLLLFGEPLVTAVNDATRIDPAHHISDHRCGQSGPFCPDELECYAGFNPDRVGWNITNPHPDTSGRRCVTPQYVERYCGILEQAEVGQASISTMGDCQPVSLIDLFHPEELIERLERLFPAPSGEEVLARYNFSSIAENPASAQHPRTFVPCTYAAIEFTSATYSSEAGTVTTAVANTAVRALNITVEAYQADTRLAPTDTQHTPRGQYYIPRISVAEQPDRLVATSQDCPTVNATTTDITIQ